MCKQLCQSRVQRDSRRKLLSAVTAMGVSLSLLCCHTAQGATLPAQDPPAILESNQCRPVYPRDAVLRREQGVVKMQFTVGANGTLVGSAIVKSSGYRELDQAALQALIHCRFKPAYRGGTPVQAAFVMEYRWQLQDLSPQ